MARRVTIQDIADELGLSRNTVSKALNQAEGIAESTRAQIFAKAAEMGYKQFAFMNLTGVAAPVAEAPTVPVSGANEVSLLTMAFIGNSHFASPMLDGFQYKLSQLGYTLNTHRVSWDDVNAMRLPATFSLERSAAIVCIELFHRAYADMLCELGVPVLFIDGPAMVGDGLLQADQLYMNNIAELSKLITMAMRAGKTRIGFVGVQQHCQSFFERYMAFRMAVVANGGTVDDRFCISANFKPEIMEQLSAVGELPDLYVCANDFVAIDTLMALREMGYDVPRDVWLAGFDDSAESRTCMPPLTTVHIHTQDMAYAAAQLFITRLEEPTLGIRQVYTGTDLIVRASTPFE